MKDLIAPQSTNDQFTPEQLKAVVDSLLSSDHPEIQRLVQESGLRKEPVVPSDQGPMEPKKQETHQEDHGEFAELAGPIHWARALSPDEKWKLQQLLNMKAADFVRFLTEEPQSCSQHSLAPIAECSQKNISRIMHGARNPSEEITWNLRHFAIFGKKPPKTD